MIKETRERIREAATRLFYEKGYNATPTKEIALEAGVNEVTIFRQFGNKEALLEEIIKEKFDVLYTFQESFYNSGITYDLQEDLRRINRKYLQVLHQNRMIIAILFEKTMGRFDEYFINFPKGFKQFFVSYLETMHQKGKIVSADYARLAEHFISANIGFFLIKMRFGNTILQLEIEEMIEENAKMYSHRIQELK